MFLLYFSALTFFPGFHLCRSPYFEDLVFTNKCKSQCKTLRHDGGPGIVLAKEVLPNVDALIFTTCFFYFQTLKPTELP